MVLNTNVVGIMKGSIKKWCMTVHQMHIRRIVRWAKTNDYYMHWAQVTSNYEKCVIVRHFKW